ncbi:MAG: hypothetical protein ABR508_06070 [Candidatus Baltobacteraceae bacterium]
MDERKTSAVLLAAGAAAGLTMTYLTRRTRARLRKPVTQAATVLAPRERVEEFIESREHVIEALTTGKLLGNIERLEVRAAPGRRGTEIYLTMRGIGKYATKDILRRAKSLLEAGEIATGRRFAS